MKPESAWNRAGDLLLDSPMDGEEWTLAREHLAILILEKNMTLGPAFFEAVLAASGVGAGHGSVVRLALFLGVGRMTVDRWRRGEQDPRGKDFVHASKVLGLWICTTVEPDGTWSVWTQDEG